MIHLPATLPIIRPNGVSLRRAITPLRHILLFIFTLITLHGNISYAAGERHLTKHWNKSRGYTPFTYATPEGILLSNTTALPLVDSISLNSAAPNILSATSYPYSYHLSFRIDNRHAHPSRRYSYADASGATHTRKNPPWGVLLTDTDNRHCWITIGETEINDDIISSSSGTVVSISADPISGEKTIKDHALPFAGETLWNIELSGGHLRIVAGATQPLEIADIPICFSTLATFGFAASPAAEILISDITCQQTTSASPSASSVLYPSYHATSDPLNDPAGITEQICRIIDGSDDPIEGYWEIFDRTLDEALLKLGGEYKLAIVKNHDRYDIVYLDGARVNGSHWRPGMLKGILTPSSFPGLLNLEWFDSEGESLSYSITAQTGYNGTLTLQFPYHSSVIRLRKVQ